MNKEASKAQIIKWSDGLEADNKRIRKDYNALLARQSELHRQLSIERIEVAKKESKCQELYEKIDALILSIEIISERRKAGK